jgi:hypothetical protein
VFLLRAQKSAAYFRKKSFAKEGGAHFFSFAGVLALDEDDYIRTIYTRNCYIKRFFFLYLFLSLSLAFPSFLLKQLLFFFLSPDCKGAGQTKKKF